MVLLSIQIQDEDRVDLKWLVYSFQYMYKCIMIQDLSEMVQEEVYLWCKIIYKGKTGKYPTDDKLYTLHVQFSAKEAIQIHKGYLNPCPVSTKKLIHKM